MGYACPVCGDPQADAEHLANHLAFTAMLGDADHEEWLAEHAPDWDDHDADRLAAIVTDHADEVEYPQVFEDTTDQQDAPGHRHDDHAGGHQHDHEHGRDPDHERSGALFEDEGFAADQARERAVESRNPQLDSEAENIMQEARELTERMREGETGDADGTDEVDATDPDDADEAETE